MNPVMEMVIAFILLVVLLDLSRLRLLQLETIELLKKLGSHQPPADASQVWFYVDIGGQLVKVEKMNLKVTQNLPVSVSIKDKFGNPAQVEGAPSWSLTAPDLADLEVSADGFSCTVKPKGQTGSASIQCSADADLGEGVKTIMGELPIDFIPGDAETVQLSAGEPSDA